MTSLQKSCTHTNSPPAGRNPPSDGDAGRARRAGLTDLLDTGPPLPTDLRRAFDRLETAMDDFAQHARVAA